jgi:biotin transporter BioY
MPTEYLIYIIMPFIVGLFGEKYKDTSTKNYAIFTFFVLLFIYVYTVLTTQPLSWKIDRDSWFIFIGAFILCTGLFHFQKVGRRKQKERQEARLKKDNCLR